jgi:hypothetical protein
MNITNELLLYSVYIHSFIILAIWVKPTPLMLLLIGIYAYIFFILIYKFGKCQNFENIKYLIFLLYSVGCMVAYYIAHLIYYKHKRYRYILLLSPLIFLFVIKFFEAFLKCEEDSNIRYVVYFTKKCLNWIKSLFSK